MATPFLLQPQQASSPSKSYGRLSTSSAENSPAKQSPSQSHAGDRFISTRTVDNEPYSNFDTKSEIFSLSSQTNLMDKLGNSSTLRNEEYFSYGNNQENQGSCSAQTDENQRMYTTLLQNQVLGVQNPHMIQGGFLNDEYMDSQGMLERSIPLSLAPPSSYNVLRFSNYQQNENTQPLSNAFAVAPFAGFDED